MNTKIQILDAGKRIIATGHAAEAIINMMADEQWLEAKHHHAKNCVDDLCRDCGRDLRDWIHVRDEKP